MADRGILFSGPMVRALLAGTKTETRRLSAPVAAIHAQPIKVGDRLYVREEYYQLGHWEPVTGGLTKGGRQKWAFIPDNQHILFSQPANTRMGRHHQDPATTAWHKRLGRFMPRTASRTTLIVTDVDVERLQDISQADAVAEGIERVGYDGREAGFVGQFGWRDYSDHPHSVVPFHADKAALSYRTLWNSINGDGAWEANPWVAAYTFTVHHTNIDKLEAA